MTSRSSKNAVRSYETEIEKSREESNWKKAVELAQQLKSRSPQHESLAHFLIGEGKLEAYLSEWPPSAEHMERAQRELSEARGYLALATDEAGRRAGVALDAYLLLGKLNYACGAYDESLKNYKMAELNTLTEKELPIRSLRIVAESYAIKGLCLEQSALPGSSRYKQAEREGEMIRSFELASELTLLYLQRGGAGASAGATLEAALQRVPLLHIRAQRLHSAVDRYRAMLTAVETASTQALRLVLARQLAELLLRGLAGQEYRAPEPAPAPALGGGGGGSGAGGGTLRRREDHVSEGPWKPKRYAAINQFVPRSEYEEVILLLLVGEAMAVRDAVLSQSAEFERQRSCALAHACCVADLLALAVTRWGQLCLVLESLERAMKFSFGVAHTWRQRALATAAAVPAPAPPVQLTHQPPHIPQGGAASAAAVRAHAVMRRAAPLAPHDASLRLLGADTCYRSGWIEDGIELAEQALAIEEQKNGPMLARCCLYAGIGYQMLAQKRNARALAAAAADACLGLLLRAAALDDNDHRAFYHLALAYMRLGRLNDAMDATRACLNAHSESDGGLRLATALWSCAAAGPRGARALAAARLARARYPSALWPLWALCALQLVWESGERAVAAVGAVRAAARVGERGGTYTRHRARLTRARYPSALWPLWALCALQLVWESGEAALATGKELLTLLNSAEAEAEAEAEDRNGYAELDALSDSGHTDLHSTTHAASVRAESVSAYRVERALSEGASSLSATRGRPRSPLAAPRAQAWLLLADLCLRLGRASAAAGCVGEAAALAPASPEVYYTRGLVHAAGREWEEARQCFQNALALHPTHLDSLVNLGAAYYNLGWLRLAEKTLREAAALEPARADTWRRLALVLAALGEHAAAADTAAAALALHPLAHLPL